MWVYRKWRRFIFKKAYQYVLEVLAYDDLDEETVKGLTHYAKFLKLCYAAYE